MLTFGSVTFIKRFKDRRGLKTNIPRPEHSVLACVLLEENQNKTQSKTILIYIYI